jgi:hypothetical protein
MSSAVVVASLSLPLRLSRHDATRHRQAAIPPDSQPELILALRDSLRRERERADRAEIRAETVEQERREVVYDGRKGRFKSTIRIDEATGELSDREKCLCNVLTSSK